jgi:hypothetical protein
MQGPKAKKQQHTAQRLKCRDVHHRAVLERESETVPERLRVESQVTGRRCQKQATFPPSDVIITLCLLIQEITKYSKQKRKLYAGMVRL